MRILYIEDDPIDSLVMRRYLPKHKVDIGRTGSKGIALATKHSYDLILLDINLGDDDPGGVYWLKQLRENGCADMPVVAITGYVMYGAEEKLMAEGFDGFLPKPIESGKLDQIVSKFDKA